MTFLIINKGSNEVYQYDDLHHVAFIVKNETTEQDTSELRRDIHWSLKRCGRWDRPDGIVIVIHSEGDTE